MEKVKVPKGTYDVLPEQSAKRDWIIDTARQLFASYGYQHIDTPIFEQTAVFKRGVGEATDIVRKEMYTFDDKGGRSMTLRPEGTAAICRAFVEHGMHKWPQPVKLWYTGPMFRYEAPQAGRYRQHYQIGAEVFGSVDPAMDAELITVLSQFLAAVGVDVRLGVASMGCADCRPAYSELLKKYLLDHRDIFSPEQLERIETNPARAFDWSQIESVVGGAPKLVDHLCPGCRDHFEVVLAYLDAANVDHKVDPTLVRGLDYYTRTVFEFSSDRLGAQSGVGGGGRYDGLVAQLGGPETPAGGWAAGLERIELAAEIDDLKQGTEADIFVAVSQPDNQPLRREALALVTMLNDPKGESVNRAFTDVSGRTLKGQSKLLDRLKVTKTVLLDHLDGEQFVGRYVQAGERLDHEAALTVLGSTEALAAELGRGKVE